MIVKLCSPAAESGSGSLLTSRLASIPASEQMHVLMLGSPLDMTS